MRPRQRAPLGALLARAAVEVHPIPTTVGRLARTIELGARTFQRRCLKEGTSAKRCLDFVHCLRAVLATDAPWDPDSLLTDRFTDARSLQRLASHAALNAAGRPTLEEFLTHQRLIESRQLLEAVRVALR